MQQSMTERLLGGARHRARRNVLNRALAARRVAVVSLLLGLFACNTPAVADSCDDAIRRHNAAVDASTTWFRNALVAKFGVSRWADIDWSEPDACERILPIYRERLAKSESILSLAQAARSVCRKVSAVGVSVVCR